MIRRAGVLHLRERHIAQRVQHIAIRGRERFIVVSHSKLRNAVARNIVDRSVKVSLVNQSADQCISVKERL